MSGLDQKAKARLEGLTTPTAVTASIPPPDAASWPAIDVDLLDARLESLRASVPSFPLALLPQPWGDWAGGAAELAGAPVDYVVQALLASVAGISGRRVLVVPTTGWQEPLRLWLAAVGAPSTGKSPALTCVRRLLSELEDSHPGHGSGPRRRIVLREGRFERLVARLAEDRRGMVLWRDDASGCLAPLAGARTVQQLEPCAISIVGSLEPGKAEQTLRHQADGAARFLYAWPQPPAFRPLGERTVMPSDALRKPFIRMLLTFDALQGPHGLFMDEPATSAFDAFRRRLNEESRQAEGIELAWLGKGSGAVACLAGTFAVMSWAASEAAEIPASVTLDSVERAVSLWWEYYRPHARAVFKRAGPSDAEHRARRVVRWLGSEGRATISREDVRRSALGQTVDAGEADRVIARLVEGGVLRALPRVSGERGGRPALRWEVNPLLSKQREDSSLGARHSSDAIFCGNDDDARLVSRAPSSANCANSANPGNH